MSLIQLQQNKKIVLVTGGSKGIGAAICRELALDGYTVAINYNTSESSARALSKELNNSGYNTACFKADVSSSREVEKMFSEISSTLGEVWGLVNNAGVSSQSLLIDLTDEMWQKMIDVNLSGAFYCSRAALVGMIHEKNGKIINIASMWGEVGASMECHYSAAKAGLIGLTKALAKEMAPSGITVNAVSPGVIMTDMMAHFNKADIDALKDETPLETLGKPEDVAGAVSYLLSEKANFITGQVLPVNGGFVIS